MSVRAMFCRLTGWLALVALSIALAQPSLAQTRRALVIGVDDYRNVSKLQKAVGDARAMKTALEKLGFEVDLLTNPDRANFNTGISAFAQKLKEGDVALVHYSGHGVALDGEVVRMGAPLAFRSRPRALIVLAPAT